jgi:hypothetical protein
MAMSSLPEMFVTHSWRILQTPPAVSDLQLASKMQAFSTYVDKTWMKGSFPAALWTHYDHVGPRTTNNAEGWHNSMNHTFGVSHPSTTTFLNWLHKYQFQVQCRVLQLTAGRPPKVRPATYIKLDQDILRSKINLSQRLGLHFLNTLIDPTMWQKIECELLHYLGHVAYLSGIN